MLQHDLAGKNSAPSQRAPDDAARLRPAGETPLDAALHDEPCQEAAPAFVPPAGGGPQGEPWTYADARFEPGRFSSELTLTPLDRVEAKPPVWECCGRLRRGAVTIVAGEHGTGKSLLAVDWAARITSGEPGFRKPVEAARPAPFGYLSPAERPARPFGQPGEAVIAHACDLPLDLLRRRIDAAGGDPQRIASLALAFPDRNREFEFETIRRRVFSLTCAVRGTYNVRLLVIDNLEAWAGNYHELPSPALLGFLLAQLTALAEQMEIAILVLAQLPRAGGQAAARKLDQLTALAPIVYLAASDPQRPDRKLLLPVKNNLAAPAAASFEAVDGRLAWSEAPVDAAADEFVAPLSRRLEARHERETAASWLLDALTPGPIESRELFSQARDCGISPRTLRRAASSLGLSPHKSSFRGPWQWRLGQSEAPAECFAGEPEASASVSVRPILTPSNPEAYASGSPTSSNAEAYASGSPTSSNPEAHDSGSPEVKTSWPEDCQLRDDFLAEYAEPPLDRQELTLLAAS